MVIGPVSEKKRYYPVQLFPCPDHPTDNGIGYLFYPQPLSPVLAVLEVSFIKKFDLTSSKKFLDK